MSLVNFTAREITCKIVYYGPGRSGKTTNLQYIFGRVPDTRRGRMVSLATQGDRTLFFDFLPHRPGEHLGVPDQVPAVHRAGAELLQRDAEAGAAGRGRRRVRGRQPGAAVRRQPREPAEPAGEPAEPGRGRAHDADRVPVQQAGPAGRAGAAAVRAGRGAQLPRACRASARTRCTAAACSRRSRASPSSCCASWPREGLPNEHAAGRSPVRRARGGRGQPHRGDGRPRRGERAGLGVQPAASSTRDRAWARRTCWAPSGTRCWR